MYAEEPPSTGMTVPVTKPLALSLDNHNKQPIRSLISPNFFIVVAAKILPVLAVGTDYSLSESFRGKISVGYNNFIAVSYFTKCFNEFGRCYF